MSDAGWLRRAGRLDLGEDGDALWSVAEGRRGRRWRSLRRDVAGTLVSDLLLELDPAGAWARLELATRDGLLTLHPDGTRVHGNVVTPEGMRHLAMPWGAGWWLAIEAEPVAAAALAGLAPAGSGAGGTAGLLVRPALAVVVVDGPPPATERPGEGVLPGPSWPLENDETAGSRSG